MQKDPSSLMKALQLIAEKREECDSVIQNIQNVAFFSAIASCESKETSELSEEFPSQDTAESASSDRETAIDIAVQKGRFPPLPTGYH